MLDDERLELARLLAEQQRRFRHNQIAKYYPDAGPLRRELYPKHLQFFAAGSTKNERLFMAANRVGKTEGAGGCEAVYHLTGEYPGWWEGRRFDRPVDAWAAGDTSMTVRDIIQEKLLGKLHEIGTGLIPKGKIEKISRKTAPKDTVDTIWVKHKSGGLSQLTLKSYDQRRESFQGTKKDFIWLDEEPPLDIYTECLLRTTDTTGGDKGSGILMLTFTPLMGMSETVMAFMPGGKIEETGLDRIDQKFVVMATWDDVPHLSQATKDKLWSSIPPFQRDARSKGVPQLGAGAIYPVPESDFVVADFEIPAHFRRGFGMDVGWNRTAAIWGAQDPDSKIVYLTREHYRGQAEPVIHANAIQAPDKWIPGVIDPAARGRGQQDGTQLLQTYKDLGLDVEIATNAVEAGVLKVWEMISTGRLKVFKSLSNWLYEFRLYRRDKKGRIVKKDDHAMDATRYLIMSGIDRMKTKPVKRVDDEGHGGGPGSWMG